MSDKVRVRFAPSPTGALHVGGVRTALFNYLLARKTGGEFLLRIEDTDQNRFVPGAEEYIIEALRWCGIEPDYGPHRIGPDAPYRQSERKAIYRQYAEQLLSSGHAYYAFDTEEEIEVMREKMKASGNKSPQYNSVSRDYMNNSLRLPADEVKKRLEAGMPYVVRIKMPRKEDIRFEDLIRGWVTVNTSTLDDKVLLKSDGMPTYHLANIVDDHLMKITHVIRGEEWLPSAPLHVFLYQAFGWERPHFAHLPLLLSPDGNGKLSKRDGDKYGFPIFPLVWNDPVSGQTASGYRESGYLPEAFINFLALLGWNPGNDEEILSLDQMAERFSLERVGKSGVKFDKKKSIWFNQTYLKMKTNEELLPFALQTIENEKISGPYARDHSYILRVIELLKERAEYLQDLILGGKYFFEEPNEYNPELSKKWDKSKNDFLIEIANILENYSKSGPWNHISIESTIKEHASSKEIPIGKVMPMLRLAVSGIGSGPVVFDIMEHLGVQRTIARIRRAVEVFS